MRLPLLLTLLMPLAAQTPPCAIVEAAQVRLADLAPLWNEAAGRTELLGYAPAPGLTRWFRQPELRRWAERAGIEAPARDLCVQRAARVYTPADLLPVLRAAAPEAASIEILDTCRVPLPAGTLRFAWSGLSRKPGAPDRLLWRGQVVYDGSRTASLWADVRITVPRQGLYARRDLAAGHKLTADDLDVAHRDAPALEAAPLERLDEALGRECRRAIAAGAPVVASLLQEPLAVARGDKLEVRAEHGGAVVTTSATAEFAARLGAPVLLRNAANGQRIRARVEAPGKAVALVEELPRPNGNRRP